LPQPPMSKSPALAKTIIPEVNSLILVLLFSIDRL
jgi:hypothetical protein